MGLLSSGIFEADAIAVGVVVGAVALGTVVALGRRLWRRLAE